MKVCPIYSLPDQLEIPDKSERFIFISIAAFAHIEHSLKTWWPYLELQFLETIRQGIVNALYHDSVHMNLVVAKYVTDNVLKRGLKYFTKNSFLLTSKCVSTVYLLQIMCVCIAYTYVNTLSHKLF